MHEISVLVNYTFFPPAPLGAVCVRMASSVEAKLLKSTKFPPEFNQKVDMQKVNVEVMKKCANRASTLQSE